MVGEGQPYAQPGDAARAAADGDLIHIMPGTYYSCAVWTADHLVIEGAGPATVMTDTSCQGKANFVISGNDVTVRDLAFTRVRVNDGNGAGIRAEGAGLVMERIRFDNNQAGVLAVSQPAATIQILGCVFLNNGTITGRRVPAAVEVGALQHLVIRNSVFQPGRAGAAIVSYADLTDIASSRIAASPAPAESQKTATVLVTGALLMVDTELEASEASSGNKIAIRATLGAAAAGDLTLRRNRLEGDGTLLENWSGRSVVLDGNRLEPRAVEESSAGAWSYQMRRSMRATYDSLNAVAHDLARRAINLARRELARNP
jgi:hypothetical protein